MKMRNWLFIVAALLFVVPGLFADVGNDSRSDSGKPNRLQYIFKNECSFPLEIKIKGRINGFKRETGRNSYMVNYSDSVIVEPGGINLHNLYPDNLYWYHWQRCASDESYAYIEVKPEGSSDANYSMIKLRACWSPTYDYFISERKRENLNMWLWDNGYKRDYEGGWKSANWENDEENVDWSSFAKVKGNNSDGKKANRIAVVAIVITPPDTQPSSSSSIKYNAEGETITLPEWSAKYFPGKPEKNKKS